MKDDKECKNVCKSCSLCDLLFRSAKSCILLCFVGLIGLYILVCRLYVIENRPKFHLARHVTSRHDSTGSICRASQDERVECSTSSTQAKCMGSTRRTCRVVSRRDEPSGIWSIGPMYM